MTTILYLLVYSFSALPPPIIAIIGLVVFIGIICSLLKLIKLILDAIPFV